MPTLNQAISALPLLDSGKVVFLVGKLMGDPKPRFDAELTPVKVRRLALFHWMTSIGLEADRQEHLYREFASVFEDPHTVGKIASLGIADMRYSFIWPMREDGMCYDFLETEYVKYPAIETLILCDVLETVRRFDQRLKHASTTPSKS